MSFCDHAHIDRKTEQTHPHKHTRGGHAPLITNFLFDFRARTHHHRNCNARVASIHRGLKAYTKHSRTQPSHTHQHTLATTMFAQSIGGTAERVREVCRARATYALPYPIQRPPLCHFGAQWRPRCCG